MVYSIYSYLFELLKGEIEIVIFVGILFFFNIVFKIELLFVMDEESFVVIFVIVGVEKIE